MVVKRIDNVKGAKDTVGVDMEKVRIVVASSYNVDRLVSGEGVSGINFMDI